MLTTSVKASAPPDNGVVDGDLWLVGGGDPLLMTDAYAQHFRNQPVTRTSLEQLADQIVAAGVREVRGSVVGDDSRYDRVRAVPQWADEYVTAHDIGPLGALDGERRTDAVPADASTRDVAARDRGRRSRRGRREPTTQLLQARGVTVAGPPQIGHGAAGRHRDHEDRFASRSSRSSPRCSARATTRPPRC